MNFGAQFVPRHDGTVMRKALIGVHHTREINARRFIADQSGIGCLGQDDSEGGRGDQVRVACGACRLNVMMQRVFGVYGAGKFPDLLAANGVGALGGVHAAHNVRVNTHTHQSIGLVP